VTLLSSPACGKFAEVFDLGFPKSVICDSLGLLEP
jgi:hypothetical protein